MIKNFKYKGGQSRNYLHHRLQPKYQYVVVQSLSCIQLFCDPVNCNPPGSSVAPQTLLSMGFPRQEYWSGDLPAPGLMLEADSLPLSHLGSPVKKEAERVQVGEKDEESLILSWLLTVGVALGRLFSLLFFCTSVK